MFRKLLLSVPLAVSMVSCASSVDEAESPNEGVTVIHVSGEQNQLISNAIGAVISRFEPDAQSDDFVVTLAQQGDITTIYLARSLPPEAPNRIPPPPHHYTAVLEQDGSLTVFERDQ